MVLLPMYRLMSDLPMVNRNAVASCYTPNSEWINGCLEAQRRLLSADLFRQADQNYKAGWNSL